MTTLDYEALAQLVRHYYPPGLTSDDPAYASSAESRRLRDACEHALKDRSRMDTLVSELRQSYPGRYVDDRRNTLLHDPAYIVGVSVGPHDPHADPISFVVVSVSVIAPLHHVFYREEWATEGEPRRMAAIPGPARDLAADLAARAERVFGTQALPPEIGLLAVPDIAAGNLEIGETTLYDALFSPDR